MNLLHRCQQSTEGNIEENAGSHPESITHNPSFFFFNNNKQGRNAIRSVDIRLLPGVVTVINKVAIQL